MSAPRSSVLEQIDRVCDRFEAAWLAGQRPCVKEHLGEMPEPQRSDLFRELLRLDLHYRCQHQETPTEAEYCQPFPEYTDLIHAVFREEAAWRERQSPIDIPHEPIPGYRLVRRLGKGGFGEVWEAVGPGEFRVALKFISLDGPVGEREVRALQVMKNVRHAHLLALFGAWEVNGRLVVAMELADQTLLDRLHEWMGRGQPGIVGRELLEYMREAAKGIDFLNERRHPGVGGEPVSIQHRDIKPQNLLLVGGTVKVADFGLARLLEDAATSHSGALTPAYAAPEFFKAQTAPQSDQYSLAVTYCHLRGGRLPFVGEAAAMMAGHLHRPPDLLMLPVGERPVVARALAKNPAERWPSCQEFAQALARAGTAAGTSHSPLPRPGGTTGPWHGASSSRDHPVRPRPPGPIRSSPTGSVIRGCLVTLLIGLVLLSVVMTLFSAGNPIGMVVSFGVLMIGLLMLLFLFSEARCQRRSILLLQAAEDGADNLVNQLIKGGANVNRRDLTGETALMKAARNGHAIAVKFLGCDRRFGHLYAAAVAFCEADDRF
jgi:serine/threonine protein kinase